MINNVLRESLNKYILIFLTEGMGCFGETGTQAVSDTSSIKQQSTTLYSYLPTDIKTFRFRFSKITKAGLTYGLVWAAAQGPQD